MTKEQKRVLIHKHLTGEFPGQKWATVEALFKQELIVECDKRIVLTEKAKVYCDAHHGEM